MAGPQNESAETAQQQSNRANASEKKKRLSKIQRVRNWIRKFFIKKAFKMLFGNLVLNDPICPFFLAGWM